MKIRSEIGNRIKQVRLGLKMNQEEFAKRIGVSNSAVSSYETGDVFPSIPTLLQIINISGTNADWILFGERLSLNNFDSDESKLIGLYRGCSQEAKKIITSVAVYASEATSKNGQDT